MTQQVINVGTAPNDGLGDPIRTAFTKSNSNFSELYSRAQVNPPTSLVGSIGDSAGMYAYDETYFYYCFADYDGSTFIWGQLTQIGNISLPTISNGDSNVKIADVNGNATVNINNTSNVVVFAQTGAYVTGVVSATGNIISPAFNGNVTATTINTNTVTGVTISTGNITVANTATVNVGNVTTINATTVNSSNVSASGNMTTGSLVASANIAANGQIQATGNITTTGYFVGNFIGNSVVTIANVPGPNTAVLFNTNGNADAVAGLTYNKDANTLGVLGIVSATGNVNSGNVNSGIVSATGNVIAGNVLTTGIMSSTGNAIHGNIATAGLITATANITGGNLLTGGLVSSTGNITSGGFITATANIVANNASITNNIQIGGNISAASHTGTTVSVTGNVTGGNVFTGGRVSATGNVNGGNIIAATAFSTTGNVNAGTLNLTGNLNIPGTGNITTAGNIFADGLIDADHGLAVSNTYNGVFVDALVVDYDTVTGYGRLSMGGGDGLKIFNDGVANTLLMTLNSAGSLSAIGNVSGSNLVTAGSISATGNIQGNYFIGNGSQLTGIYTTNSNISTTGNITGGNLSAGTGTVTVGNIVNSNANGVGNIGSSTTNFNTVFAKATSAQYADLAENYTADANYTPGTVVVFGGEKEITVTQEVGDERVAGVISTDPAHLMNAACDGLPVALRGRVPVNVIGPVVKGDSLVTATTSGFAISVGRDRTYGQAVFAKALETNNSEGEKVITAVIL